MAITALKMFLTESTNSDWEHFSVLAEINSSSFLQLFLQVNTINEKVVQK